MIKTTLFNYYYYKNYSYGIITRAKNKNILSIMFYTLYLYIERA